MRLLQVYVDPPRITALTLPARCRGLAPAVDMDRKATVIDGQTDGRTDQRTDIRPSHRPCTAYSAGSVNNSESGR